MRMRFVVALLVAVTAWALQWVPGARADVLLGLFNFDSTKFGNSLTQSDGGAHATLNWLNVVNEDPGPAYLTGANFDTGISNITSVVIYEIGYNTPILNDDGNDFGVVVARFSADPFTIAVSTDGGNTFSNNVVVDADSGISTGVTKNYFSAPFAGDPFALPFAASLFVHPLDLSSFGLPDGAEVNAILVTGTEPGSQWDLIRVAGFDKETQSDVAEPATLVLLGLGIAGATAARRFRR